MPRKPRIDFPGAWHHITNRGISKRTIFERVADVRFFLSRVARAVRQRLIEVHVFCLLTTHFHLLARSPAGRISVAMQRIQGAYSRYFNRRRRRDGSLYRARYFSKVVDSLAYRDNTVRYIDGNAVEAGLVAKPEWYPAASAHWYARGEGPPWLTRDLIEKRAADRVGADEFRPEMYTRAFAPRLSQGFKDWIERRLHAGEGPPDPLADLIAAAPPRVLAWMRRKAALADGTGVGLPLVPADELDAELALISTKLEAIDCRRDSRTCSYEEIARAGQAPYN